MAVNWFIVVPITLYLFFKLFYLKGTEIVHESIIRIVIAIVTLYYIQTLIPKDSITDTMGVIIGMSFIFWALLPFKEFVRINIFRIN